MTERNNSTVIEVKELRKNFDDLQAVAGISFAVHAGEVFGFLGPNGAGKTTTMEILAGLQQKSSGEVSVLDRDPAKANKWLKQKIGVQQQIVNLFPRLTIKETLSLFASFYHQPGDVDTVIEMLELDQKKNDKIMYLSGGQLKRVAIGNAIVGNTEILFLDEPTAGLDPQTKQRLWTVVNTLKKQGRTIFLTTHSMEEAQELCDRVCIIDHGKIIDMDNPLALIKKHFKETAIELGSPLDDFKDKLLAFDGVTRVDITEDTTNIFTTDVPLTISGLMGLYKGNEGILKDFRIRGSNLEDVFLKLTGRRIRE